MESLLRLLPTSILLLPTIITTDSNLHSADWNPDVYTHHNPDADRLLEVMTNWDLHL